jgi:hypothetical protein
MCAGECYNSENMFRTLRIQGVFGSTGLSYTRGQRPAWRRRWQLGESAALAAASSLAAEAAAWQERGVGGVGSAAAA